MTVRPDSKGHPLWNDAMALARDAYDVAECARERSAVTSTRLRKAAVSVPAHVAGALSGGPKEQAEHMCAARAALAEVGRQAATAQAEGGQALAHRAMDLDKRILFEFGATEAVS